MRRSNSKRLFFGLSAMLCAVIFFALFFLYGYSLHQDNIYKKKVTKLQLDDISSSVITDLKSIENKAVTFSQTTEFLYFSNKKNSETSKKLANKLFTEDISLMANSEVIGCFLYNSANGYIQTLFRSLNFSFLNRYTDTLLELIDTSCDGQYQFSTFTINGHYYILYYITKRFGNLVIVIDPYENREYKSHNTSVLNNPDTAPFEYTEAPDPAGSSVLIIDTEVPLFLSEQPLTYPQMDNSQRIMLIMIIIVFLFTVIMFLIINHLIINPINTVSEDLITVSGGDTDYRLSPKYYLEDINILVTNINEMLDNINEYKSAEYDSRMDAVQAKMQFLQLQIRPHFLLNCLKNLISLMNLEKYSEAKELSYYLSDYISYNFSDTRNFVPLKNELTSVQNYVKLCSLLNGEIKLTFQIDGNSSMAECLPLSVLSCVENCIKHTHNISSLCISIFSSIFTNEDNIEMLKIVIKDNGGGFSEEYLEEIKNSDVTQMVYRKNKIGINNIKYRLGLSYGSKGSVNIYNENEWAVVEIIHPFERIEKRS